MVPRLEAGVRAYAQGGRICRNAEGAGTPECVDDARFAPAIGQQSQDECCMYVTGELDGEWCPDWCQS